MALQIKIFQDLARSFSDNLPAHMGDDSMDAHVDYILPKILPYSEDLAEHTFWLDCRWKEVRDDATFHESILHIFSETGEYLLAVDGNIIRGGWRNIAQNTLILEVGGRSELFDLAFLHPDFMILKKHGDQQRKGLRKYFVMVNENSTPNVDWRNHMEALYNIYRGDCGRYMLYVALLLFVLVAVILFSK